MSVPVAVIMGSSSDLPLMEDSCRVLRELEIGFEVAVLSAHRTPGDLQDYINRSQEQGVEVFIAGAGGAAHLPGVIASHTVLPVIGVPLATSSLKGQDALHAVVQMPRGIPVATVAIDGAGNAALLAAQILAVKYPAVKARLQAWREKLAARVRQQNARLSEIGLDPFLEEIRSPREDK